ncbi:hypothetical protein [Aestuariivirga sp.]|jgi:hypothetical protein|uniref:hypothetical protein n=1 Tax=Aestuariivirga sp. TaxID=2650926 RepID=UPI003784DD7D
MKDAVELLLRVHILLNGLRSGDEPLDVISREILLSIATSQINGKLLRISDIRFNPEFGSPVTALSRLRFLMETGWVKSVKDPVDGRAQLLALTTRSNKSIVQIAAKLRRAIAG